MLAGRSAATPSPPRQSEQTCSDLARSAHTDVARTLGATVREDPATAPRLEDVTHGVDVVARRQLLGWQADEELGDVRQGVGDEVLWEHGPSQARVEPHDALRRHRQIRSSGGPREYLKGDGDTSSVRLQACGSQHVWLALLRFKSSYQYIAREAATALEKVPRR